MTIVVSQVNTVIDVMKMLTIALDNKDPSQLEALTRKVQDWLMDSKEQQVILELITSVDATIEDALLAGD